MKASLFLSLTCVAAVYASAPQRPEPLFAPVPIVSHEYSPSNIAVDEESVYWVSDAGSTIKKASKTGSNPTTVVTGQRAIAEIFVDDKYIFFVVLGEIRRASKNGGATTTLVSSPSIRYSKILFAMDQTNIYFMDDLNEKSRLVRVRKDSGGMPVTLASKVQLPAGLATDGTNVYWTDVAYDRIKRVNVKGGPILILGRCSSTLAVALNGEGLYCMRDSKILSFSKTGGKAVPLLVVNIDYGDRQLVFDGANFYIKASVKGIFGIYKISKNGGRHELLAPLDLYTTSGFVTDSSSIYWTDSREGTVMRLSK